MSKMPSIPPYSRAKYPDKGSLYQVKTIVLNQKETEILKGRGNEVEDLSDQTAYRFRINNVTIEPLTVSLVLTSFKNGVQLSQPVLKGNTVDQVDLSWTYNKQIESQELTNTGGIPSPTLSKELRAHSETELSILSDTNFTISGTGKEGTSANAIKTVSFGNYSIGELMFHSMGNYCLR
jgi:hypothetical protein